MNIITTDDVYILDSGETSKDKINGNFKKIAKVLNASRGFHWAEIVYSETTTIPLFPDMKKIIWAGGYNLSKLEVKSIDGIDSWVDISAGTCDIDISAYALKLGMLAKVTHTTSDNCATLNLIMI